MGNSRVADTSAAAELRGLAREAIAAEAGQTLGNGRMARAGDRSFWGIGVPSIHGNMSSHPPEPEESGSGFFRAGRRGAFGTGWWWDTPDNLLDKIDEGILVRDTRICMHTVWRLLTARLLPLDYAEHGRYLPAELEAAAGGFSLGRAKARAMQLLAAAEAFNARAADARDDEVPRLAAALHRAARALVPVDDTGADPFDHDPALPTGPHPGLQPLRRLGGLHPGSDTARFLETRMVRARTRVEVALAAVVDSRATVTEPRPRPPPPFPCPHAGRSSRGRAGSAAPLPRRCCARVRRSRWSTCRPRPRCAPPARSTPRGGAPAPMPPMSATRPPPRPRSRPPRPRRACPTFS